MLRSVPREVINLDSFTFYPAYYAHGMLSCIYWSKLTGTTVLIVLDPRHSKFIVTRTVEGHPKVAVRNTDKFLFFCLSLPSGNRHDRRWRIYQFDIEKKKWFPEVVLEDFDGREIGGDICFEVIDGYFYAISDHVAHCVRNDDPTVLDPHHVLRMPISSLGLGPIEAALPRRDWKRDYSSDLADFRWNSMQLEKDEREGELTVFQVRREFLAEGYHNRRTCYKKRLGFPRPSRLTASDPENAGGQQDGGPPPVDPLDDEMDELAITRERSAEEVTDLILDSHSYQPEAQTAGIKSHLFVMPQSSERLNSRNPWCAVPSTVHHGDNATTSPQFPYHQCFVRSYFPSCDSFVDMVNPVIDTPRTTQKLRLRIMTRNGWPCPATGRNPNGPPAEVNQTLFWPPELDNGWEIADGDACLFVGESALETLHRILNPRLYSGEVEAVVDYGSLIYAVPKPLAGYDKYPRKTLIYIGFDPSVNLHSLHSFHESSAEREEESEEESEEEREEDKLEKPEKRFSEVDRARSPLPEKPMYSTRISNWLYLQVTLSHQHRMGFHFHP